MRSAKACPIVLRQRGEVEILAFRHPLAGRQLVKGTVEPNETPDAAALRELAEEAGIIGAHISGQLGSDAIADGQTWHFPRVAVPELPDSWTFRCADDGGHEFAFFWHPLFSDADDDWHPTFRRALVFIQTALR